MTFTKRTIVYFIILLSCLMLGKSLIFKKIISNIEENSINSIRRQEINLTSEIARDVESEFSRLYNDIEYIANSPCSANSTSTEINTNAFREMMKSYLSFYDFYRKASIFDTNGIEIISIESANGISKETPNTKLRNLSKDAFFINSLKNKRKDILISNIIYDNNSNGYAQSSIDISAPIFNKDNKKMGIVVLTYNFQEVIQLILSQYKLSYGSGQTIDEDGYWITSSKNENANNSININFKEENSTVFSLFSRPNGQTFHNGKLYTFNEILPFRRILEKSKKDKWSEPMTMAMADEIAKKAGMSTRWISYTEVSQGKIYATIEKNLNDIDYAERIVNYVIILLAITISMLWTRRDIDAQNVELHAVVREVTNDSVVITDKKGFIISSNRAFTQMMGYSPKEAEGLTFDKFYANKSDIARKKDLLEIAKERGHWKGELWKRRKDGVAIPTITTISFISSWKKSRGFFVEISTDISNFKETEANLKAEANHDPLTRMPNRLLFEDRFDMAIKHAKREKNKFAVLYIDLDKFKPINDEYGHEAGDIVLCECSKRMSDNLRDNDTVARIGGDEFAVILENIKTKNDVDNIIKILEKQISRDIKLPDGYTVKVGASFGYAIYPDDTKSPADLVKIADQNMYKNKKLNGGSV